jgi:glutathione S-transferase
MALTLYHCPDWCSSVIRLALEELGVAYTVKKMDFEAGDFDAPAFRALNPFGLIPTVETDEGPMFEAAAILLWLVDRHGRIGPRTDEPGRAAFLSWLFFVSNTLHPTVMALIHPERVAGDAAASDVQRAALEKLQSQANRLEALVNGQAPGWLSTKSPGALGYYLGILLRWAMYLPEDEGMRFDLRPYPALRAVLASHEGSAAALRVAAADSLGPTPFTDPKV